MIETSYSDIIKDIGTALLANRHETRACVNEGICPGLQCLRTCLKDYNARGIASELLLFKFCSLQWLRKCSLWCPDKEVRPPDITPVAGLNLLR